MSFDPASMISVAKAEVGYHEGSSNYNKFSGWQTYGRDYHEPWCASFASYCAYQGGFRFPNYSLWGERGDWNVVTMEANAKRAGYWRDRSYRAQAGDLCLFGWHDRDAPDHVEIVLHDAGPGSSPRLFTVGGNTGDAVLYRSRYEGNLTGFPALTLAGQTGAHTAPTLNEVKLMGMVTACVVPGARMQANGVWKDRYPMVGVFLESNGSWTIRGMNGAVLRQQSSAAFGESIYLVAGGRKLVAPIRVIEPVWGVKDVPALARDVSWPGDIVALADDGGTFHVQVSKINYL